MASPATSLSPPTQPSTPSSQPQAQQQQRALLLTTASALGISAHSFIHSYTLASSLFAVTIATPGGGPLHFPETDANSRRWLDDFLAKPAAVPVAVESLDLTLFAALLIPGGAGTITDLPHNAAVAHLAMAFDRDKKLICAVGLGVSVLCASALLGNKGADWQFAGRCMTAPSNVELARTTLLAEQPLLLEDFLRDNGACYSAAKSDSVHVVIDNNLITAQNDASTLSAVQNLILLGNNSRRERKAAA